MNPNIAGIVAVAVGLVVFRIVSNRARGWSPSNRLWTAIVCAPGAIASLMACVYYLHLLPERAWFYELRSWRGSEFLVIFLGGLLGVAASCFPRRILIAWLFLFLAVAM